VTLVLVLDSSFHLKNAEGCFLFVCVQTKAGDAAKGGKKK